MYEIEIKSLLGSKERADELKRRLVQLFPALKTLPAHKQRNHYFESSRSDLKSGERSDLKAVKHLLSPEKQEELAHILRKAQGLPAAPGMAQAGGVSIRTRDADGKVYVVLKVSIGDDTSANGVSRIEFEEPVRLTLEELDKILLDAGLTYQAKWSREREHFDLGDIHITVDKNAGYGYVAEFEKMIDPMRDNGASPVSNGAEEAKRELRALMAELRCEELSQDRLERMFKFYNEHWREYYGTDRVFVIE